MVADDEEDYVDGAEQRRLAEGYLKILGELALSRVGSAASRREREELNLLDDDDYRYAEIGFEALYTTIQKIKHEFGLPTFERGGVLQTPGGVFVDLGSGMGKACIAAALAHPFDRCVGVETLEGVFELSKYCVAQYDEAAPEVLVARGDVPELVVLRGHLAEYDDFAEADLVLFHAACFSEDLVQRAVNAMRDLAEGTFVIAVSRRLPEDAGFELVDISVQRTDGYESLVFLYRRTDRPRTPEAPGEDPDDDDDDSGFDAEDRPASASSTSSSERPSTSATTSRPSTTNTSAYNFSRPNTSSTGRRR